MAARLTGATTIVAIDEVPERLALAKELGATHTLEHGPGTVAELKELTREHLDYSVEATDGSNLVSEAVEALGIRGTCAMVGGAKMTASVNYNHPDVLLKGKRIIGVMGGGGQTPMFLESLMLLQRDGRFPLEKLVTVLRLRRHQPGDRRQRQRQGHQAGGPDAVIPGPELMAGATSRRQAAHLTQEKRHEGRRLPRGRGHPPRHVTEPKIEKPTDAIVRLTASAICGTDLHMVRGTMPGMKPGTILGHEGVGVIEEVGTAVTRLPGRRPRGRPLDDRLRALLVLHRRLPLAVRQRQPEREDRPAPRSSAGRRPPARSTACRPSSPASRWPTRRWSSCPAEISDDQAILLSDIFPTGYFGADLAEIKPGDTVGVFGCGPVGLFAIVERRSCSARAGSSRSTRCPTGWRRPASWGRRRSTSTPSIPVER